MKFKALSLLSLVILAGCSGANITPADPNPTPHDVDQGPGIISNNDGNLLSSFKGFGSAASAGSSLQVNEYVWRSALQSISFMPLTHVDSAGGVILSDWMAQQQNPNKEVKVNLYVLSKRLDSKSLDVKVFEREVKADGSYSAQALDQATSTALEETILSNARTLKIRSQAN